MKKMSYEGKDVFYLPLLPKECKTSDMDQHVDFCL